MVLNKINLIRKYHKSLIYRIENIILTLLYTYKNKFHILAKLIHGILLCIDYTLENTSKKISLLSLLKVYILHFLFSILFTENNESRNRVLPVINENIADEKLSDASSNASLVFFTNKIKQSINFLASNCLTCTYEFFYTKNYKQNQISISNNKL